MAQIKRVIQKIEAVRETGFEQQFWPIVIALCILGGFVYGASLALLDGLWLWISLISVPIVICSLIAVLHVIDNRILRRSIQLAMILSITFHIALLIILNFTNIFNRKFQPENVAREAIHQPVVVNEYARVDVQQFREVRQEEIPVEEMEEPEQQETQPETSIEQPQPTPVTEPQQQPQPNVNRRQQQTDSTPRREQSLSRMSRQTMQVQPKSGTAAEQVETQSTESKVQARETTVQKQGTANSPAKPVREAPQNNPNQAEAQIVQKRNPDRTEQPTDSTQQPENERINRSQEVVANVGSTTKVETEPTPATSSSRESPAENPAATKVERQEVASRTQPREAVEPNSSPTADASPTRMSNRRSQRTTEQQADSAQPAQLTRSNASVNPRSVTPEVSSSRTAENPNAQVQAITNDAQNNLNPAQTQVTRQQPTRTITPSNQSPQAAQADLPTNRRESDAVSRRPNRQQQPEVAQSNTSTVSRAETANPVSARTETRVETPTQQSVVQSDNPQPNPTSSQIARQPTPSRQSTNSRNPSPTTTSSTESQVARTIPRRSNSTAPSISTNDTPSQQPRRSTEVAANVRSQTNVENPATSQNDSADGSSSPQPASLTVSRSNSGTAGEGSSSNLMADSPAAENPSLTASNSRRRSEPTRNAPQDQAFAPSSSSRVPRSAAGQMVPSSSVAADNSPNATQAGESNPSTLTANASPATIDSASSATASTVSADSGSSQVDLGPVKVVSESGNSRASGGGQASPNMPQQAERVSRSTNASGAPASLMASTEADDTAAPQANGGGQPQENQNDLDAASMVQLERGGATPTTSGPTNAITTGPPSDASSAMEQSSTIAARAERSETAPGEQTAGGGTPTDQTSPQLVRATLAGGPDTSSIALIENESTDSPRSDVNGPTLAADASGIDAPSVEAVASQTGDNLLQKLAGGETGSENPASSADFSGNSSSIRRNRSDANVSADSVEAAAGIASLSRNGSAPRVSTDVSADDAEEMAAAAAAAAAGGGGDGTLSATEVSVAANAGGSGSGPQSAGVDGPADSQPSATPGEPGGKRRSNETDSGSISELAAAGMAERQQLEGEFAANTQVDTSEMEIPIGETGDGSVIAGDLSGVANVGLVRKEANAGELVDIEAPMGPGGAGAVDAADSGLNSRRARQDNGPLQAFSDTRFFRLNPGGVPTFNKNAVFAKSAFDARGMRDDAAGGPSTEKSIEMGLEYLAGIQRGDGRWMLEHETDESITMHSDTAATGLAMLAFQGAGYNHREYKYADQLSAAVQWMVENQQANGDLYVKSDDFSNTSCQLYSHGIAALALCEAYGMTQDPALKEPAQKALNFIAESQDKEFGGWRYSPGRGADTSVTGWMMMAMKSGRLAGLETDQQAFDRIRSWLDQARTTDEAYLYRYNPYAEDDGNIKRSHGRIPTQCMTSVGLLMRLYLGWNRDNVDMLKGADYLMTRLPDDSTTELRDTYYWYYATQVLRHVGGERWEKWHAHLHPLLVESQVASGAKAGSWDPLGPVPDRWGPHGGRLYVTTMNLLSLEVDYRLLPLYDKTVE